MQRKTSSSLSWLTFDHLSSCPRLVHGVFLRHGGVSSGEFDSLNFGRTQGDLLTNVTINRQRALEALSLSQSCRLYQIDSNKVVEACPSKMEQGDGLITNVSNLPLMILHADCQAAIIYDPINHALANIHCGWRGNVQNIYKQTLLEMKTRYGSRAEDLLVGISPSLGPEASEFVNYKKELPKEFEAFQHKPTYFNLWEISRWQLIECGVLPEHIEIAEICTFSNPEDYFSYRRVKRSGRHATIASLRT